MFVCEPCHKKRFKVSGYAVHFSGSQGPCEFCKTDTECHNCWGCIAPPRKRKTNASANV